MEDSDLVGDITPLTRQSTNVTREDERRSRILRRYLNPQGYLDEAYRHPSVRSQASETPTSPNAVLTALSQLVCLRLNTKRAILSVVDLDTTYTLAEGTRSLNLIDTSDSDPGDGLFIGCASLPKSATLCQNVIAVDSEEHPLPLFTVPDLSKDDRFKHMPMVTGEAASFRFYVGTPLVSDSGVNIGAIAAIDTAPRDGLTPEQAEFLVHMSKTIMNQLELKRQADERTKIVRMSRGLNAFIQGKAQLDHGDQKYIDMSLPVSPTQAHTAVDGNGQEPPPDLSEKHKGLIEVERMTGQLSDTSEASENSPSTLDERIGPGGDRKSIDEEYRRTLSRAANLLHECQNFGDDGGVVFLEANFGVSSPEQEIAPGTDLSIEDGLLSPSSVLFESNAAMDSEPSKILGVAPRNALHIPDTHSRAHSFLRPLPQLVLQDILKRYKRGKLWTFDGKLGIVSSDDDQPTPGSRRASETGEGRYKRRRAEAKLLQHCFPGARHVMFVPLWDAALARTFAACFCYTTSPVFTLAKEPDLNFVTAFANSIMMEISRLKTMIADQQKGDFIGSISHELRSPLHGVLASAEFLAETECNNFQRSLVDTVESCGRTLLDTINHVLDFSRINAFEKTLRSGKGPRTSAGSKTHVVDKNQKPLPGLLSIFAHTDIAAITEEVVDSVFSGRMYSDISPADITDISSGSTGGIASPPVKVLPVDVVLDIQYGNYNFFTQPGALRRVIMNIFGNALKYTEKGMILIKVRLEDSKEAYEEDGQHANKIVRLIIKDTGKGISPSYLRTRLFTPFAQENVLAQGTGLGLSIVKSIVTMLGGSIRINSTLGAGTEVIITLPVGASGDEEHHTHAPTATLMQNDAIVKVRALGMKKDVGFFGYDPNVPAEVEMQKVLEGYVTQWYGMRVVSSWATTEDVNVIIVDEKNVAKLLETHPTVTSLSLIILCSNMSRHKAPHIASEGVEYVTKPPGPFKLAKAFRASIKHMAARHESRLLAQSKESSAKQPESELERYEASLAANQEHMKKVSLRSDAISPDLSSKTIDEMLHASEGSSSSSSEDLPGLQRTPGSVTQLTPGAMPVILDQIATITTPTREVPATLTPTPSRINNRHRSPLSEGAPATGNRQPRILLVDDNAINLRLLQMFTKKNNYEDVDTAENGLLALEAVKEKRYDVIFMDLSMPVMDGFESTRLIRQVERERREKRKQEAFNPYFGAVEDEDVKDNALIIALTGLASSRDQIEASDSGINIFMTKPVSFREVGGILANWRQHAHGSEPLNKEDNAIGAKDP